MVAFKAGVSPPAVKIPIRFIDKEISRAQNLTATSSGIKQTRSQNRAPASSSILDLPNLARFSGT
jgi:hypothetical protein